VALSHEIGAVKPGRAAYDAVLDRIGVPAGNAAYVGTAATTNSSVPDAPGSP
jgi:FMN phosphatase YigB (HAD superfamily)